MRLAGRALTPVEAAGLTLTIAAALVLPARAWRIGRAAITAVHEAGHALAAVLSGRRVAAVHLRADTSGVTYHCGAASGIKSWPGRLLTAVAGYPAPALLGLGGASLVGAGHARLWLVGLLVLGVVTLVLWVRNVFGVVLMLTWVGAFGWVSLYGSATVDFVVAGTATWYLLLGGLRASTELFGPGRVGDAEDVASLVHLPVGVCKAGFWLATAAVTTAGGAMLFGYL